MENVGSILGQTTIKYFRGEDREMQKKVMRGLRFFTQEHKVPIILTNHLSQNSYKPALGTFWNGQLPKNIYLSKEKGKYSMHYLKNEVSRHSFFN